MFWYNLHPNGDGDYRTRHAACPVLLGNKWGEPQSAHTHSETPGWQLRDFSQKEEVQWSFTVVCSSSAVSNKWIHERGQEFRRRCSLQETH